MKYEVITAAPAAALVDAAAFVAALTDCALFVDKRSTAPIMACALLRFGPAGLTIQSTNLDQHAFADVPCITDGGEWSVAVEAHPLLAALKKSKASEIEFRPDGEMLAVTMGAAVLRFPTHKAEDFPQFNRKADMVASFPAAPFATDLARVALAISTEETRYYLNGIYFHAENGALRMVATDGHRMHILERPLPAAWEKMPDIIVPRDFITPLAKIMKAKHHKADETISMSVDAVQVVVELGALTIISKVIDGNFPDYRRVIPGNFKHDISFGVDAMRGALDTVRPAVDDARAFSLALAKGRDGQVSVRSADSNASAAVPVEYQGAPYVVGFNIAYVADVLKAFGTESVRLQGADASCPHLFTSDDVPGFRVVLMPVRVCDALPTPAEEPEASGEDAPAPVAADVEPPMTRDEFVVSYTEAWEARDGAAMRAAISRYRSGIVCKSRLAVRLKIIMEASACRKAPYSKTCRAEDKAREVAYYENLEPTGSFAAYVEAERAIGAALPAYEPEISPVETCEAVPAHEEASEAAGDAPCPVQADEAGVSDRVEALAARVEALAAELNAMRSGVGAPVEAVQDLAPVSVPEDEAVDVAALIAERDALRGEVARLRRARKRMQRAAVKVRARARTAALAECQAQGKVKILESRLALVRQSAIGGYLPRVAYITPPRAEIVQIANGNAVSPTRLQSAA